MMSIELDDNTYNFARFHCEIRFSRAFHTAKAIGSGNDIHVSINAENADLMKTILLTD